MDTYLRLGTRDEYYNSGPVRMSVDDRGRHMLISGRTGTGKSTLLANLFAQEANSGRGALLIDPHGELAQQALNLVPSRRIRKTIYLNPSDLDWPIGFNVLDNVAPDDRAQRAANVVAAFHSVWASSWGPRLEQILYNSIAALLEVEGSTLLAIPRLLTDARWRAKITAQLKDPVIAQFWRDQFPMYEQKFGAEAVSPVLNKVGQLLASPAIRNIIGQPKSSFDPRHLMDNNYLVIANFSKGRLGEQHANLLGSLLISAFGSAALSRDNIPEPQRKPFAMIIDEFPNYTTNSFASLLSEARKYQLSLTLAHQYLDQMTDQVRSAVLGNVGSIIVFRTGAEDCHVFARQLSPLQPHQLTDVSNHRAFVRLLQWGEPSDVFQLKTLPPPSMHGHREKIIKHSRIHFATERHKITSRIERFLTSSARNDDEPRW